MQLAAKLLFPKKKKRDILILLDCLIKVILQKNIAKSWRLGMLFYVGGKTLCRSQAGMNHETVA